MESPATTRSAPRLFLLAVLCACTPASEKEAPAILWLNSWSGGVEVDWPGSLAGGARTVSWRVHPGGSWKQARTQAPFWIDALPGEWLQCRLEGSPILAERWVRVRAGDESPYFPTWFRASSKRELRLEYDPELSPVENGLRLSTQLASLVPGDRLLISKGVWSSGPRLELSLQGTAQAPIRIEGEAGTRITRPDQLQNTVNIGSEGASYLLLRNLEITGGDIGLRIHRAHEIWIDRCRIHHTGQNAIAVNTHPTERIHFTRNQVSHTRGTGEGFYLGGNRGEALFHTGVVAQNYVHHTAGLQGDGIELKQGSYANLIAENVVHDTRYPAILVYGTAGRPPNRIERNVCWASGDYVLQVQGEARVANNLAVGGRAALKVGDHQGKTVALDLIHNTLVNEGPSAEFFQASGRPGLHILSNAFYSGASTSLTFYGGDDGVELTGNVLAGPDLGLSSSQLEGRGTSDFLDLSFDGARLDARPAPTGALREGSGGPPRTEVDLLGRPRSSPSSAGALEHGPAGSG